MFIHIFISIIIGYWIKIRLSKMYLNLINEEETQAAGILVAIIFMAGCIIGKLL